MLSSWIFSYYHGSFYDRFTTAPERHTRQWNDERVDRLKLVRFCEYGDCHRYARDILEGKAYCYIHFETRVSAMAWDAFSRTWYGSFVLWVEGMLGL